MLGKMCRFKRSYLYMLLCCSGLLYMYRGLARPVLIMTPQLRRSRILMFMYCAQHALIRAKNEYTLQWTKCSLLSPSIYKLRNEQCANYWGLFSKLKLPGDVGKSHHEK